MQAAWTAQPAWEALPPQSRGLLLRALARLDPREPRAAGAQRWRPSRASPSHEARGRDRGDGAVSRLRRRGGAADHRRHHPLGQSRRADLDPEGRARRRRGADRLELSCRADDPQDRAGADRRQHRGGEVARGDADGRARDRRSSRCRRAFRPASSTSSAAPARAMGRALVTHPLTRLVTLTGSVRAGKDVFRHAADDLKLRAARARRQGALRRRRGRRHRRGGPGGGEVALRELRADLHLQRADVPAREDRRGVPRPLHHGGARAQGGRSDDAASTSARSSPAPSSTRSSAWSRRRRPPAPRC